MIIKTIRNLLFTALFAAGITTSATARDFAEIFTDCGLGAMIAPSNDAVAAVTNVTWDLGTTAVTSNVSSPDTCAGGKQRTAAFIYQSYDSIVSDLSKGHGKYLEALLALSGYAEDDYSELTAFLREDLAVALAENGYSEKNQFEKAEQLYEILYGGAIS